MCHLLQAPVSTPALMWRLLYWENKCNLFVNILKSDTAPIFDFNFFTFCVTQNKNLPGHLEYTWTLSGQTVEIIYHEYQ